MAQYDPGRTDWSIWAVEETTKFYRTFDTGTNGNTRCYNICEAQKVKFSRYVSCKMHGDVLKFIIQNYLIRVSINYIFQN